MKTYYGVAATNDQAARVTVRERHAPTELTRHYRHSTHEFSWGGPSHERTELSRCILMDSFGVSSCPESPDQCRCLIAWVEPNYKAFAQDVLSKLPVGEDWKLSQAAVMDWTFDHIDTTEDDKPKDLLKV